MKIGVLELGALEEPVPSESAVRDAVMMQVLMVLWVTNRKVYGAHKLRKAARRAGTTWAAIRSPG